MTARLRQLFVLVLLAAVAFAAVRWWSRRDRELAAAAWPPLEVPTTPTITTDREHAVVSHGFTATVAPPWLPPLADGSCPEGYPVKANDNSGIYHVPGGRFYARTKPERCYAEAERAAADGYRPAKA